MFCVCRSQFSSQSWWIRPGKTTTCMWPFVISFKTRWNTIPITRHEKYVTLHLISDSAYIHTYRLCLYVCTYIYMRTYTFRSLSSGPCRSTTPKAAPSAAGGETWGGRDHTGVAASLSLSIRRTLQHLTSDSYSWQGHPKTHRSSSLNVINISELFLCYGNDGVINWCLFLLFLCQIWSACL